MRFGRFRSIRRYLKTVVRRRNRLALRRIQSVQQMGNVHADIVAGMTEAEAGTRRVATQQRVVTRQMGVS